MPVLDPQPLDQLGRVAAGLGELFAEPFAERGREGVHLTDGWLALLLHRGYQSSGRLTEVRRNGGKSRAEPPHIPTRVGMRVPPATRCERTGGIRRCLRQFRIDLCTPGR